MDITIYEDQSLENINYTEKPPGPAEFVNCTFSNCVFQGCDLTSIDFLDCSFGKCNFSNASLNNTGLKNCVFTECKLIGIDFSRCSNFQFSVSFTGCYLDYSSFFQKKMKKTVFVGCSLKEVEFAEVDLTAAVFTNCDLLNASFVRSVLEKADLRTAVNYSIDPEQNKLKKAKFSYAALAGLLNKYDLDIQFE